MSFLIPCHYCILLFIFICKACRTDTHFLCLDMLVIYLVAHLCILLGSLTFALSTCEHMNLATATNLKHDLQSDAKCHLCAIFSWHACISVCFTCSWAQLESKKTFRFHLRTFESHVSDWSHGAPEDRGHMSQENLPFFCALMEANEKSWSQMPYYYEAYSSASPMRSHEPFHLRRRALLVARTVRKAAVRTAPLDAVDVPARPRCRN